MQFEVSPALAKVRYNGRRIVFETKMSERSKTVLAGTGESSLMSEVENILNRSVNQSKNAGKQITLQSKASPALCAVHQGRQ